MQWPLLPLTRLRIENMLLKTSQKEDGFYAHISCLFPHLYTSCHIQEVEELREDFPGLTGVRMRVCVLGISVLMKDI